MSRLPYFSIMGKKVRVGNGDSGSSGVKERRKRPRPILERIDDGHTDLATENRLAESKFAKALGSTDFHTREKGLAALTRLAVFGSSLRCLLRVGHSFIRVKCYERKIWWHDTMS